jgi:hypothetical protein
VSVKSLIPPWFRIWHLKRRIKRVRQLQAANDERFQNLKLSTVGMVTSEWSDVDVELDYLIDTIHGNGGRAGIQSNLPVSLTRRCDYLKLAAKSGLFPGPLNKAFKRLASMLLQAKERRHDFVHGTVIADTETYEFVTMRTIVKRGSRQYRERRYSATQVSNCLDEAKTIAVSLRYTTDKMRSHLGIEDAQNA